MFYLFLFRNYKFFYSKSMGGNVGKIILDKNTEYFGEIDNNVPNRKGKLELFKSDSKNERKKIWDI